MSGRRVQYVFVVELNSAAAATERVRRLNPHMREGSSCVYVGTCSERPATRFPDDDFSSSRNRHLRRRGRRLLDGYQSRHVRREGALSRQSRLIDELREEGFVVVNSPPQANYCVYVVELRAEVARGSVLEQNPDRDPAKPCLYVGQTSRSPSERLLQHLEGGPKSSGAVRRFGTEDGLRPDLAAGLEGLTELKSLREERRLAAALRRQGYTVLGGT